MCKEQLLFMLQGEELFPISKTSVLLSEISFISLGTTYIVFPL
jgi:hypothetical protein